MVLKRFVQHMQIEMLRTELGNGFTNDRQNN